MNLDRNEMAEGARKARRALGKPEPDDTSSDKPKTQAERRAEWLKHGSAEQRAKPDTTSTTRHIEGYAARDFGRPPSSYAIGERKIAMDGTVWTRAA